MTVQKMVPHSGQSSVQHHAEGEYDVVGRWLSRGDGLRLRAERVGRREREALGFDRAVGP